MSDNGNDIYTTRLILPYSAINANGRIKADWLLNVFQDTATRQCCRLGISGFDMAKKKLKWVVAQYKIKINDTFHLDMPLILKTWRAPWKNLYEIRQFTITADTNCNSGSTPKSAIGMSSPAMVNATGIWVLIRSDTGRPVRLSPHMPDKLMQAPVDHAEPLERPGKFEAYDHEALFPVRFLDLDLNQHVNNRVYLRWAVESLPEPLCFQYAPSRCTVVYRREALLGDHVQSRIKLTFFDHGLSTEHAVVNQDKQTELARLKIDWEKISHKDSPLTVCSHDNR